MLLLSHISLSQETDNDTIRKAQRNTSELEVPDREDAQIATFYSQEYVDRKADFPGGMKKFYAFVDRTFRIPSGESFNGKVILYFIVEKDGSLTNIKVVRNTGYGSPEEAVKMMHKSPKWIPAQLNGKNVRSNFVVPITFASKK